MKTMQKLAIFAAGYVLGTRAGRERYDEIRQMAQRLAQRVDDTAADVASEAEQH